MTQDKSRAAFEAKTQSQYDGDFTKYTDGYYVNDVQQDHYLNFNEGWQSSRALLLNELQSEEVVHVVAKRLCVMNLQLPNEYTQSGIIRWKLYERQAQAAITAITTKLGVSDGK